jgi:hypothetical protein
MMIKEGQKHRTEYVLGGIQPMPRRFGLEASRRPGSGASHEPNFSGINRPIVTILFLLDERSRNQMKNLNHLNFRGQGREGRLEN